VEESVKRLISENYPGGLLVNGTGMANDTDSQSLSVPIRQKKILDLVRNLLEILKKENPMSDWRKRQQSRELSLGPLGKFKILALRKFL